MRKLLLLTIWGSITSITFMISLLSLNLLSKRQEGNINKRELELSNTYIAYASLPQTADSPQTLIKTADAREDIVRQYLQKYNSPLTPHAADVISISDKYSTQEVNDLWRYVVAIAQCESNLGARMPPDSFNAWGLGIPTGAKNGLAFDNWPHGTEIAAKFLRKLMDKGLTTPEEWGPIYAPPSAQNGGSWAKCVRHFLENIQ